MADLIAMFQALFKPRETQLNPVTTVQPPLRTSAMQRMFSAENGRRAMITDCQRMYDEDTRPQGIIKMLARDTVKAGFELRVSGPKAKEAQKIAEDLLKRLKVMKRLEQWVNRTLRDGDSFFEIATNAQGIIVEISRKPTLELHRWSDDFDTFYNPAQAFFWTDQAWNGINPPANAVYFAEWQIIHARGDHDENSRYGRPLFASARKTYKRVTEGELDISIRRKTRAGMKFVHALEGATDADIEAYKVRNKSVLSDPFGAISDYFSNKKTSVSTLQGDANLDQIGDVEHHIDTFWVAAPTPKALLGYGKDLNRDILDEQKEQYDGVKESLSQWLNEEILRPLIERQWLLLGIWPDSLDWDIEWAAKDSLTPDALLKAAQAITALGASGKFTDETIIRIFSRFIPEFDAEAEIAALKAKQEQDMADELDRIEANAQVQADAANVDPATGQPLEEQPPEEEGTPPIKKIPAKVPVTTNGRVKA